MDKKSSQMGHSDLDLSQLRTVCSFDRGSTSTWVVGLPSPDFSPASLLVESLIQHLCKFLDKDPASQRELYMSVCQKLYEMNLISDSYRMDEFQFLRSNYQSAFYRLLTVAKQTCSNKALTSSLCDIGRAAPNPYDISRYLSEFVEIGFIANGGFGNVFKVRHKLDGEFYAIKKIYLRYHKRSFFESLNEVKMLARLHHPNIVTYKAAWLEHVDRIEESENVVNGLECSSNYLQAQNQTSSSDSPLPSAKNTSKEDTFSIVFESSKEGSKSKNPETEQELALCPRNGSLGARACRKKQWACLFIQMQLCDTTLRKWLDYRNESSTYIDIHTCLKIFKQVTAGLAYIHSQKIVHHDIKPSNIFVDEDLQQVQLGDFGLACSLVAHGSSDLEFAPHVTKRLGTELYAAPEQLKGICHPSSDVYSLGIVLFELVHPFSTSMERSKTIQALRLGHIPLSVAASYPQIAGVVSECVRGEVELRPSASDLLARIEEAESKVTLARLEQQEATIARLRTENITKDQEIAALQLQLQRLMALHPDK